MLRDGVNLSYNGFMNLIDCASDIVIKGRKYFNAGQNFPQKALCTRLVARYLLVRIELNSLIISFIFLICLVVLPDGA